MNKNEIRKRILNIRRNFYGDDASIEICKNISNMEEYKKADVIAAFVPYKSETNILPLILKAMSEKEICFPITDENDNLEFYFVDGAEKLKPGKYGILQPPETDIASNIDFMLVPGIAFDSCGFRIGYGKGCYDRYLNGKNNIFTCGVGYSFQLVDNIEHEAHDVAVRAFAYENEILYF